MKSITVKHNTSTVAILDKWLVVNEDVIVATFGSRQQARESKLGTVVKADQVDIDVVSQKAKYIWANKVRVSSVSEPCKVAYDLVQRLYGTVKPKIIFEEAQKQGVAYLTATGMYNKYRKENGLVKHRAEI